MKITTKRTGAFLAMVLAAFLGAFSASAHVSLKNGNFFIPFKDLVYLGGYEPKIERIYNSKSTYLGMFGWGWGSELESYLTVSVDGSVIMHEYGGGATNRFVPAKKANAGELNRTVEMLAETARSVGIPVTTEYKGKLKSDADFRNREWTKFLKTGKVKARTLSEGEQLVSTSYSYQYITKVKGGYVRKYDSGKIEKFDEQGKLVQVADNNANTIDLTYTADGRLAKLVDNLNRKMFFTFNKRGRLEKISGENAKETVYKYNDQEELVYSKDADSNVTTYKYTSDKRHNLTEMVFTEKASGTKSVTQIAYWSKEKYENVRSVREGDTLTEYDYAYDKPEKGYSSVSVDIKNKDGQKLTSSKYEYWTKPSTNLLGEPWTYRMVTTLDGDKTDTIYNECCGLPIQIIRGGEKTNFAYDRKGRVIEKSTPTEVTKLRYDSRAGKVARVEKFSKISKKDRHWSVFTYDGKGNLMTARNSDKKTVKLVYDPQGRIVAMVDQDQRKLKFKYDPNQRPSEITDERLGTIRVSYTNSGEVKSVDTTAGRKIAYQVTSAFQNLLDIIRPAGVNLSF